MIISHKPEYSELLIGCGSRHGKILFHNGKNEWSDVTTLDINQDHMPDVVWDLNNTTYISENNGSLQFALTAVKPSRIKPVVRNV